MMKEIGKNECHYYQFTCSGREGPQILVTAGSIRYTVKEGAVDQPGHNIISNATVSASTVPVLISTGIHEDEQLYTLFIKGSGIQNRYEVSPLSTALLSVYRKEQSGLPTSEINGCKHHEW